MVTAVLATANEAGEFATEALPLPEAIARARDHARAGGSAAIAVGDDATIGLRAVAAAAATRPGAVALVGNEADFVREGLTLVALDAPRLATLEPPQPVFALAGTGLAELDASFGLDAVPHNLPMRHVPFVGRTEEVAQLAARVGAGRVLTITGPGGVGKTETLLRVGALAAQRMRASVTVVELASLDRHDLSDSIAEACAAPGQLVVLLDNAEHVVEAIRTALTSARDDIAFVVSSRAPLGTVSEELVVLDPLPHADAVALFNDRARRAGATPTDAAAVSTLCERLDFLPLAIELAAARSRVLSAAAITDRLGDRFSVLTGARTTGPAHHASLEAAIAWSYDLLDDAGRAALERLAVFADRFDLSQAEHTGVSLDAIAQLVDQSLVATEPEAEVPYRLLDSVRAFSAAQARARGTDAAARDGLVAWLLACSAVLEDHDPADRDRVHGRLDRCPADVRLAIEHALHTDPAAARTLVGRLGAWFWDRGRSDEGLRLASAVLAADPGDDPLATARLANAVANLAVRVGDPASAIPHYERALELRTRHGAGLAQIASTRNDLGACLMHHGDLAGAAATLAQARDEYALAGDQWGTATATMNLAAVDVTRGENAGAAEAFRAAAATFTAMSDHPHAAAARTNEGLVLLELGDHAAAFATLSTAVREALRYGVRFLLAPALAGCAAALARNGDAQRAAALLGAAEAAGHVDEDLVTELEDAVGHAAVAQARTEGSAADDDTILAWLANRQPPALPRTSKPPSSGTLRREPKGWRVTFDGETAQLPPTKGTEYIARLLAAPGAEVHVGELTGTRVVERGSEIVDDAALAAYRQRVAQLQRRLDDADARGDVVAGVEAQAELDHLAAELRRSTDRHGRPRLSGGASERARKSVGNRIRDAIRAIGEVHPALARHLEHSVTTGTFCQYAPEHTVAWDVRL